MKCYQLDWVYEDEPNERERRALVDANCAEDAIDFLREEIAAGELVKVVNVEVLE